MAAGACVSADPAIAGAGARPLAEISTRNFTPPRNLRSVGAARQRVVRSLSDRAWTALDEPELASASRAIDVAAWIPLTSMFQTQLRDLHYCAISPSALSTQTGRWRRWGWSPQAAGGRVTSSTTTRPSRSRAPHILLVLSSSCVYVLDHAENEADSPRRKTIAGEESCAHGVEPDM